VAFFRVVTSTHSFPLFRAGDVRSLPFFADLFGSTGTHANAHAFSQHDVQCQELTRIREYESRILEREAEAQLAQLRAQTAFSASLTRVSTLLRRAFRALTSGNRRLQNPSHPTSLLGSLPTLPGYR